MKSVATLAPAVNLRMDTPAVQARSVQEHEKARATQIGWPALQGCRRRPTLPRPLGRSTIGAARLNDRVRDGNGCGPCALVASDFSTSPARRAAPGMLR